MSLITSKLSGKDMEEKLPLNLSEGILQGS